MSKRIALLSLCGGLSLLHAAVSQTPPMGWNSYDSKNFSATETEVKAIADTMAKKYLPYGWNYVVVDWCWSFPGMGTQGTPNQGWTNTGTVTTRLNMDVYGRPLPDTVRHPSSRNGMGFKPLADYVHSKGLKFGIHLMRGMYRQAYWANTPISGTTLHAQDVTDITSTCPWLDHTYGLKMDTINGKIQLTAGAQAYLNSLLQLFAYWGVDFLKVDDLSAAIYHTPEVEGYRKAIDSCGREMVFSTSPGATPLADSAHVASHANQWRMANDMWDSWANLNAMIDLCANWYREIGPGHFPDADMIPIGRLSERGPNGSNRYSALTSTQQYTLMTMWSMARSPLVWGGDLAMNRAAEDSLMTNADVLAIDQKSSNNRPITISANYPVWGADSPDTNIKYCALFNRTTNTATVSVNLATAFGKATWTVKNLWTQADMGNVSNTLSASLPAYGSALYKLTAPGYVPIVSFKSRVRSGNLNSPTAVYEVSGRKIKPPSEGNTPSVRLPEGVYIQRNEKGN